VILELTSQGSRSVISLCSDVAGNEGIGSLDCVVTGYLGIYCARSAALPVIFGRRRMTFIWRAPQAAYGRDA